MGLSPPSKAPVLRNFRSQRIVRFPRVRPPIPHAAHGRLKHRTSDASPPPLSDETSVTETRHQGDALRTSLMEI